jgi:hypothetical protein
MRARPLRRGHPRPGHKLLHAGGTNCCRGLRLPPPSSAPYATTLHRSRRANALPSPRANRSWSRGISLRPERSRRMTRRLTLLAPFCAAQDTRVQAVVLASRAVVLAYELGLVGANRGHPRRSDIRQVVGLPQAIRAEALTRSRAQPDLAAAERGRLVEVRAVSAAGTRCNRDAVRAGRQADRERAGPVDHGVEARAPGCHSRRG